MALLVQKFGGTSVGTLERIRNVAKIVARTREAGHQAVVVVSAMAGETDRLVELAKHMQTEANAREYAALVATGEQVSMSLLALCLQNMGYPAKSFTGAQAGICTDNSHRKARILKVEPKALTQALEEGFIPVVAGFQGITEDGDITTLGRGGSDTTAVALAASLKADECQIYTDVDGVYTADPFVVPEARRLERITFEEMLELASLGAKVLQIRAVEFAGKYNVVLRVLSSFNPDQGTLITYEDKSMEHAVVSGIAFNRNEAKLTIIGVPDQPGSAFQILGAVSEAGIEVDMIIQNIGFEGKTDFTFTIHRDDYAQAMQILKNTVVPALNATQIIGNTKIAKLSLVGVGMRNHAGIASKMFRALADEGINIQLITTSEIKVSVVIDEKYIELGARALHMAFDLGNKVVLEEFDPPVRKLNVKEDAA